LRMRDLGIATGYTKGWADGKADTRR
jgi:hypothetical protein